MPKIQKFRLNFSAVSETETPICKIFQIARKKLLAELNAETINFAGNTRQTLRNY
jgi:hypothetical protein